jgi:hypothetical protein
LESLGPGTASGTEVVEREIAGLLWHQRGHRIEVIYVEGAADHFVGTEAIAAVLADDAGLSLVASPVDYRRWSRRGPLDPEAAEASVGAPEDN